MSPPRSFVRADHIEYGFYLVFDNAGGVRMTRNQPALSPRERSMQMTAKLPKSLFATPSLHAEINVADGEREPMKIDVSAAENALGQVIGCDVVMTVIQPEGE